MKCFTDLDGKIPAEIGDRVARKESYGLTLIQPVVSLRPILKPDGFVGGETPDEYWEMFGASP